MWPFSLLVQKPSGAHTHRALPSNLGDVFADYTAPRFPKLNDLLVSDRGEFVRVREVHPRLNKVVCRALPRRLLYVRRDGFECEARFMVIPGAPAVGTKVLTPLSNGVDGACTCAEGCRWNVTHESLPAYVVTTL